MQSVYPTYAYISQNHSIFLSKNFHNTNITKNFETSKFISTFLKYFLCCFKKLWYYKYNKKIWNFQTFLNFFSKNHRCGTMERTWYSSYNLGSGVHTVHLLWRSTSIIPIRIVVIYMTDTSLLYPYSLSNQNQTDPL